MKKFEYKTLSCSLPSGLSEMETELEKLGKQGWELVSVCPSDGDGMGLTRLTAFLKKEIN